MIFRRNCALTLGVRVPRARVPRQAYLARPARGPRAAARNSRAVRTDSPVVLANRLISIVWPARCAACNSFIPEGMAFCRDCDLAVVPVGACCPGCAMPANPMHKCPGCLSRPFPFARAKAALAYGGALTQALLRFKHGGHRHLARPLAALFSPVLGTATAWGVEVALPVPLHPRRLRQRGYNQALDLLRAAMRRLPRRMRVPIACDALARTRHTPMLGRGSPQARRQLLHGAFEVSRPGLLVGKHVLVVDDVMTTGATLAECTRVLLVAGVAQVSVATLARAIG
jgi:ComF family protein